MRIAVDAMGGDFGPSVVVPGALVAQRELGDRCRIALYGDKAQIRDEMSKAGGDPTSFEIVHAPDNIGMSEAPAAAIRRRTESSIVMASRAMRAGEADAFVSAGSTGAVAAAGLLLVGRLPKVDRPAIASLYPTQGGAGLLLDVGANVDCKPRHLLQFGAMGRIYTEHVLGVQNPKVALLNIV
jgi:glycerol-3-phosphate acyltransferase PlsX